MTSVLPQLRGPVWYAAPPARRVTRWSGLRSVDWLLALAVAALCGLGALLVWSATRQYQLDHALDPAAYLKRHLVNTGIGLALAVLVGRLDYTRLRRLVPLAYAGALVGLAAVLAVGSVVNGARSWIVLAAGFQLQPSELAKVALVLSSAALLSRRARAGSDVASRSGGTGRPAGAGGAGGAGGSDAPRSAQVLLTLAAAVPTLALIMLQPDFGTTMVFAFVLLGVLVAGGAPKRWIALLLVVGATAGVAVFRLHLLKAYQLARLTEFLSASKRASSTTGYNVDQALIANAHGGVWGRGLFHGSQTQGQFVPEQKTDFVFTVAGEELGFVGAAVLLALLALVIWRALRIAQLAPDRFGTVVAAGVASWFAFQTFVNVGMTLSLTPVTGLPLPFVSYGGSAMFANLLAVGLLQSVHARGVSRD